MKKKAFRVKTVQPSFETVMNEFEKILDEIIKNRKIKEEPDPVLSLDEYNKMIFAIEKLKLIDEWRSSGRKIDFVGKDIMELIRDKVHGQSKIQAHKIMKQWQTRS